MAGSRGDVGPSSVAVIRHHPGEYRSDSMIWVKSGDDNWLPSQIVDSVGYSIYKTKQLI